MARLTAVKVKNLRQPGRYGDGQGLYLNVAPRGSKSWVQRIAADGKRSDLGLGGYPTVGLAEAREKAVANKKAVREGGNPVTVRSTKTGGVKAAVPSAPEIPTFRETATFVHSQNSEKWESAKAKNNWWQRAERYVFPVIGDMAVGRIGRTEVLGIVEPVWTEKPETARRIRLIIKTVMARAMAHGHIEVNPAGEIIDAALPAMPKFKVHFEALPYAGVATAIEAVESSTSYLSTKAAFRFLVLTAARSGEVRGTTWGEVDFDRVVWNIPASRMKTRKEHRVPLSLQAMELLRKARELHADGSPYIFPNDLTPSKPLSENALSYMLRRIGMASTVHGFRSSFRDWASENTDASHAVMELSLAHDVGSGVVQSYARSDLLERRRELMQQWADYLCLGGE